MVAINSSSTYFESLPLDEEDAVLEDISAQLGIDDGDTDYRIPAYQHGP